MRIYVGNLPYGMNEDGLRAIFEEFGTVGSVDIINDRETGRSKGFGFVVMPDNAEGQNAIENLDGKPQGQPPRSLRINEALPRQDRGRGHFNRGSRS